MSLDPADLKDDGFTAGQLADAKGLGDEMNGNGTPEWNPQWKQNIDGVLSVAGSSPQSVEKLVHQARAILGSSIKDIIALDGHVRPGKEKGHEQ